MEGEIVKWENGRPIVPDFPVIGFIEGDGIGPDIWKAAKGVFDKAVEVAYKGKRKIIWKELFAGEKAKKKFGDHLPEETIKEIERIGIVIKGPLTTPVGKGFRSINVTLRQRLDLYACIRPVRYIPGVPAPIKNPERVNVVIFRENTEDVYAGIEWEAKTEEAKRIIRVINEIQEEKGGNLISEESSIGIKPMSEKNTKRLVRKAILYAIENKRKRVTLVHKGNIMKFTEGRFRDWGYELAKEEFGDIIITEEELKGEIPDGKILINDRIADAMFQQLILRPEEYEILATPNLNGDYLSDAAAALVGGLGMAPGANIGDRCAIFEATHGTAPKYAGLDKVNPGSLILSGVEMFKFMGWNEVADIILDAMIRTIKNKTVTYDLARQMEGAKEVKCSEFGKEIEKNMELCHF